MASNILNENVHMDGALELICRQCGLCCHTKVRMSDGSYVIHPDNTCEHLGPDNKCRVYPDRFEKCNTCLSREEMVARDYVLPEGCPYTKLRPDYKTSRVVTPDEFEYLIAMESFFEGIRIHGTGS